MHADPPFPRAALLAPHELGRGRLEPGTPNGRVQKRLRIDATGAPSTLIGRLLVGSYITGQDQVVVTALGGFTADQRREIHRVVDRLLGMTVVGDTAEALEVQNFIDPSKYELPRLLHRVVQVLRGELAACHDALVGGASSSLRGLEGFEEEVDRLYLLMARQLLLSSDSPRIARDIDVESRHYQVGYRLVAKALEVTGDLVYGIGTDLDAHLAGLRRLPPSLTNDLALRIRRLEEVLTSTMAGFAVLSVVEANTTLNRIAAALKRDATLGQRIARQVTDRRVAVAAQRIVCNLVMALEMLVVVNEVTINRGVEPETVALTGTRVVMLVRGVSRAHDSHEVPRPLAIASIEGGEATPERAPLRHGLPRVSG